MHNSWQLIFQKLTERSFSVAKLVTNISQTMLVIAISLMFITVSTGQISHSLTVVIDPGHGGHDVGTAGEHSVEKDVALDIALLTGQHLKDYSPKINVIYTRESDIFIPLNERIEIANNNEADLFVSIHCNALANANTVNGIETYVMGLHVTEENLHVAKRENASILLEQNRNQYGAFDPNSVEGHILLSAMQNVHLEKSINLASLIQQKTREYTNLKDRGVKQAGFVILRMAQMPSVLVETAFLTSNRDERFVNSRKGQNALSAGIAMGILKYFASDEGPVSLLSQTEKMGELSENKSTPTNYATATSNPTTKTGVAPEKTVYRIQVASMAARENFEQKNELFSLNNVDVSYEDGYYKYLTGNYDNLQSAVFARSKLRDKGYPGAFVVAYRQGKRIKI